MHNPEQPRPAHSDQPVILIAEDEAAIQKIVRAALEKEGYVVFTAGDGAGALILSQQYPGKIHLLLTDIMMPKLNGVELSNRISAERPGIQIVFMSGSFADNANPEHPFMQKPFPMRKLRDTIKGLVPVCQGT